MALNGTLEELAVLDLVQFVNQAQLSGALVLKTASEQADLFYRKGALVHARLGDSSGLEVLVRIVDWTAGSFFFQAGETAPAETIVMDLHRAVMYALKTRDERALENEKRKAAQARQAPKITLEDRLAEIIAPFGFVQQAVVFDASGVLATACRKGSSGEDLAPLCKMLADFGAGGPRGKFRRAIFDDEKGTVLVSALQAKRWVVIVVERGAALGAAMTGMGRMVAKLEALGPELRNASCGALAGVV